MQYNISTDNEIEERFWQIPEDLQDAAIDEKRKAVVLAIGKEHGVREENIWILDLLVFNILLAVDPIKGFAQRIASQAQVATPIAQKIADQINENVFRPVRDSLIKIHEIPASEQAEVPATEQHFEHLLEIHSPGMIALAKPVVNQAPSTPRSAPTAPATAPAPSTAAPTPKTLAEQKMSRPTSLPPQVSRATGEPDPYREPIA